MLIMTETKWIPKTYDNIKVDFSNSRTDAGFCFKHSNLVRKVQNYAPHF